MAKIFTIGFSGKSPDAFLDVLNAVRVRAVWDIRLWRTSTYVPFYSGDSLACVLGTRYEYHPEFAPTSEILAGYKDGRITWPGYERMYWLAIVKEYPSVAELLEILLADAVKFGYSHCRLKYIEQEVKMITG